MISRGIGVAMLALLMAASATTVAASGTDWHACLRAYVGCIGGSPEDLNAWLGVTPGATEGWDAGIDTKKPDVPAGECVYTWFERPAWGQGAIARDMRLAIAEGTSKIWGIGPTDTFNVKVNVPQEPSGVFDECGFGAEFPVASPVHLTWDIGPFGFPPPPDYEFILRYEGGISPKPAGTAPPDIVVPILGQAWDMKAVSDIVFPLWHIDFQPWNSTCDGLNSPDTAKFKIIVENPYDVTPPTCDITFSPDGPAVDEVVSFNGNVTGGAEPYAYAWDFGDGSSASGNPASHAYADIGTYTVCLSVSDDQGEQTTCCTLVAVRPPCECSVAIDRTHCKIPAAGHVGQCRTGQIGARNESATESCTVVMRLTNRVGNVVFETVETIEPAGRIRVRFSHCFTPDEVGKSLWMWEVWPVDCGERTPWNNAHHRRVILHP